jgi:hypothetical protein
MPDRLTGRMVFLVGAPRSGTNWLQRMLAAHPQVVALPSETHLFSHGLKHLDAQVQHGLLTSPATGTVYLPREEWVAAMREFCVLAYGRVADAIDPDARVIVERTPHHVLHLPLIAEVFPDAAVLHIVRDGRDVVRSLARQEWGPGGIREAAGQWRDSITSARDAAPALPRYLEVRYEDLMGDARRGVTAVFRWLDLAADDEVLAAVETASQLSFNVDPTSPEIGIGKWRTQWSSAELAAFDAVAGDTRRELGYADQPLLSRSLRRRLKARLRRRRATPELPREPVHNPVVTSLEAGQIAVDAFLAAMSSGKLPDDMPESIDVSYVGPAGTWSATGPAARQRLSDALEKEGPWGRQLRGEEQMHGRTVVVTTTHAADDGGTVDRVVVLGLTADGRVDHIGYRRFPLPLPGAPS